MSVLTSVGQFILLFLDSYMQYSDSWFLTIIIIYMAQKFSSWKNLITQIYINDPEADPSVAVFFPCNSLLCKVKGNK